MFKDSLPPHQLPQPNDLSVPSRYEVEQVLLFIDNHISGFSAYYNQNKNSVRENWISNLLVRHFNLCNCENGGYLPYEFSKNPPQEDSTKETDIGVYINTRSSKAIPIIEFEAKRFSESSNNQEYVYGERGGIERFKKGEHSKHLNECGMFAYVQSRTIEEWFLKVNRWIINQSKYNNSNEWTRWTESEQLSKISSFESVEKFASCHNRNKSGDAIFLWHYFIDLTNQ